MPLRTHPDADYICVFMRHRHELPDGPRHAIAALAHDYQNLIEQLFVEGIASGEFRADLNPQLATLALLGLCNSVIAARALPHTSASTISSTIMPDAYRRRRSSRGPSSRRAAANKEKFEGGEETMSNDKSTRTFIGAPTSTGSSRSSSVPISARPARRPRPRPTSAISGATSMAAS